MIKKKGQVDASNAAALVALIAALIVLYIMFLPPDIRQDLLNDNTTNASITTSSTTVENDTLLNVVPGKLSFISETKVEHPIPSITLSRQTNAKILKSENPFYIKRGWFDEKKKTITFTVDDLQNTNNFQFAFSPTKYSGNLIVMLNGKEIFNSELTSSNPDPIILPKELITKDNQLEFSTDSVGIAFWRTNEFNIVGGKIIADVTDISRQQSKNIFIVTSTESYNANNVYLEFNPNCNSAREKVGQLDILLNGNVIYSAVPDCKILNTIKTISTSTLESGENNVVFKTSEGSYLIDQIQIVTQLRDVPSAVYYFELSNKQYNDLVNDRKKANLTMEFVDRGYDAEADIIINGHKTALPYPTRKNYYKVIPKDWLKEDTNYINIQPKITFDAVSLKVELANT